MRRFFAPDGPVRGRVVLRDREAYHAARVLRLQPGAEVIVVDGSGNEHVVRLTAVDPRETQGEVLQTRAGGGMPIDLILVQGVPKGAKMDDVIRMGTELGVREFIPVLTKRAVAEGRGRTGRWRRIAVEAAKQSRRADVPEVADPTPFSSALERLGAVDLILLLWEGERTRTLADILGAEARRAAALRRVALLVGPEGGFDETEVSEAVAHGAAAVSLGPFILRTETAGVAAVAMVLYELTQRRV